MSQNSEEKLKAFLEAGVIDGEHLQYEQSLHTVQELLEVTGLPLEQITKTMIFIGAEGETIAAMVPAQFRVSSSRLGKVLEMERPEMASPDQAYERTGYPVGGMPCFGYEATLVIDPKVFDQEVIYTGGGSTSSITKVATGELKKLEPIVQRISGNKSN